jgi:hypothetical protein
VEPERVAEITAALRDREKRPQIVGVFRDASAAYMREIAATAGLDRVQLHGAESDDDIRAVGLPATKTFRVGDTLPDTSAHPSADWFLFDTYEERRAGGTGRRFDWSLLSKYPRTKPFFLAGGMNADNIERIELIHTPPANFDAEGNAGIINIVLKKNAGDGFNGNYSVSAGYGMKEKAGANLNANYRRNRANLVAIVRKRLLHLVDKTVKTIARLDLFTLARVVRRVRLRVSHHPVDLILRQAR